MGRWRVYVKPFDNDGNYLADFIEVTKDVIKQGDPRQGIDNTDFDVGVIKNSGFSILLRNDHGKYSEVDKLSSIFSFTRKNTLIQITWDARNYDLICGFFQIDEEILGGEYTVFDGLINEVTSVSDIDGQSATFSILGFDSLLDEMEVPFSSINNGDLFSAAIFTAIDQTPFNTHVSVGTANISLGTDLAIDDVSSLENKTVGGVLRAILLAANSVLYINDGTAFVTDRTASAINVKTFSGQASRNIENMIDVPKYRDGLNRMFNLWTWIDTVFDARDTSSITKYGVRAKAMSIDLIADASQSKIEIILNTNRTEFAFPKIELDVETPIWYDTLALKILDRVNIDYPTVYIGFEGQPLPRYGLELLSIRMNSGH